MTTANWLSIFVPTLLTAVGGAWAAFWWLGQRLIEQKFAEKLEGFRHDQQQEIERLRHRINVLMDRTVILHQHEFEVLPTAWEKLDIAFSSAAQFTSRHQQIIQFERMPAPHFEDFLEQAALRDYQKAELRALSPDARTAKYEEIRWGQRLNEAQVQHADFHNYILSKGIFIQPDLKKSFTEMSALIASALSERKVDLQYPSPGEGRFAKADELHARGPVLRKQIEDALQGRLWQAESID